MIYTTINRKHPKMFLLEIIQNGFFFNLQYVSDGMVCRAHEEHCRNARHARNLILTLYDGVALLCRSECCHDDSVMVVSSISLHAVAISSPTLRGHTSVLGSVPTLGLDIARFINQYQVRRDTLVVSPLWRKFWSGLLAN